MKIFRFIGDGFGFDLVAEDKEHAELIVKQLIKRPFKQNELIECYQECDEDDSISR